MKQDKMCGGMAIRSFVVFLAGNQISAAERGGDRQPISKEPEAFPRVSPRPPLAPSVGMLAFYNWAEKCPWKRFSIEKGGHGFFSNPARVQFERELAEYLKIPLPAPKKP